MEINFKIQRTVAKIRKMSEWLKSDIFCSIIG